MMRKEKKGSVQGDSEKEVHKNSEKISQKERWEIRQGVPLTDENLSSLSLIHILSPIIQERSSKQNGSNQKLSHRDDAGHGSGYEVDSLF